MWPAQMHQASGAFGPALDRHEAAGLSSSAIGMARGGVAPMRVMIVLRCIPKLAMAAVVERDKPSIVAFSSNNITRN